MKTESGAKLSGSATLVVNPVFGSNSGSGPRSVGSGHQKMDFPANTTYFLFCFLILGSDVPYINIIGPDQAWIQGQIRPGSGSRKFRIWISPIEVQSLDPVWSKSRSTHWKKTKGSFLPSRFSRIPCSSLEKKIFFWHKNNTIGRTSRKRSKNKKSVS